MIKELYTLFDKKAEQFGNPMCVPGLAPLLRDIRDELKKGQGMLSLHPEDFVLYYLGSFDDLGGFIEMSDRAVVCEVVTLLDPAS